MIYGREAQIASVARSRAPILLVIGDSGVGKSEVLIHAQQCSPEGVAPDPITLDRSPGNLQRGLLHALAGALARITEQRGVVDDVGRRVERAALALAREQATELAKAVGAELLALVRGKLGSEFGEGIAAFVRHLRAESGTDIRSRIGAASDPSIAQTVVGLANELLDLAEGAPLLLALDAAESMTPADRGVLADLAGPLAEDVCLRVGFATSNLRQQEAVDELLAVGAGVQTEVIRGLDQPSVAAWLREVHLDAGLAERTHRVTGGYPLLVQSVIADIRAGGRIDNVPVHKHFAAQTELAWNALDPTARACARRLAVLPEPLPDRLCAELCAMSLPEYADAIERLRRGFILATVVNGRPWFHEQRRTFVRARLTQEELADASSRAATIVLEHLRETEDLGWVQPLSELAAEATTLLKTDPQLAAAVELPRAELAVCAALIELAEKQHEFVVHGDDLLRHARAWFGANGDLVPALRALAERDFVALLERPHISVARPKWPLMTMVTLQGRAAREFGRLPIPSLTSLFFALGVKPALGSFERFAYGVGRPSWTAIAHSLLEPRKPIADVRASPSFGELKPALLARGHMGGRPLYCAARYESASDRDETLRKLEALDTELFNERLRLDEVLSSPGIAVASERFVIGLDRAAGERVEQTSGKQLSIEEAMELKAQTLILIRSLCSPRERIAADLNQPASWHWLAGDDWVIQGAVRGAGDGAVHHTRPPVVETNDPYRIYRLIDVLDLPPSASLGRYRHELGTSWKEADPVADIVGYLADAMRDFNGTQQPRTLRLDADDLRNALLDARRRALADARALTAMLPVLGERRRPPKPEALYLVLIRTDPAAGLFYGEYLSAHYETVQSETSEEEVHVALIDSVDTTADRPRDGESPLDFFRRQSNQIMQAAFDRDAADPIQTAGDAQTLIARLLGYDGRDLRLVRMDETGSELPI